MSDCEVTDTGITITLGILLTIGTALSYVPQEYRIIRLRSSKGISPLFLFIGGVFSFGSLISICLLQYSSFQCCTEESVNFLECNGLLLNIYQIGVMPLNIGFIFVISLIFVEAEGKKLMYTMFFAFSCLLFVTLCISTILIIGWGPESSTVIYFADCISVVVLFSTLVQYLPQIYSTFIFKGSGSVSLVTLAIQAPGNIFVVIFQLLSGSSIATWFPFFSSFIQQSILIAEIIFFDYIRKKNVNEEDMEKEALLGTSNEEQHIQEVNKSI